MKQYPVEKKDTPLCSAYSKEERMAPGCMLGGYCIDAYCDCPDKRIPKHIGAQQPEFELVR